MKQVIEGLQEGLKAIADAMEGGYPEPTAASEGQVLTADGEGGASWEDAADGLPEIDSQVEQGAVLAVGYSREPEWVNDITDLIPNGSAALVPTTTGVTNGYVLTNNSGTPTWAAGSGGGSYPEPTSATSGQVLTADGIGGASWQTPSGGGGTTIYKKTSTVEYDDKSDMYYASVEPFSTPITGNTVLLAVYYTDGNIKKPLTTGYGFSASMDYLQVNFDSNPNVASVLLVFATPELAS